VAESLSHTSDKAKRVVAALHQHQQPLSSIDSEVHQVLQQLQYQTAATSTSTSTSTSMQQSTTSSGASGGGIEDESHIGTSTTATTTTTSGGASSSTGVPMRKRLAEALRHRPY